MSLHNIHLLYPIKPQHYPTGTTHSTQIAKIQPKTTVLLLPLPHINLMNPQLAIYYLWFTLENSNSDLWNSQQP